MRSILFAAVFATLFASFGLLAEDASGLKRVSVVGKLTVSKDKGGKVQSVTITCDKGKSYTISPMKAVDKESGKTFTVTEGDVARLAKYDGQMVRAFATTWNGMVISLGTISEGGAPRGGRL